MAPSLKNAIRARRAGQPGAGEQAAEQGTVGTNGALPTSSFAPAGSEELVDLTQRREQLRRRVAELQWNLGGLVYEMAIRDNIRVEVIVRRAAALQEADAELSEVERILRTEETGAAGSCASCNAPHSSGAVYCWQCGQPLLDQVPSHAIGAP